MGNALLMKLVDLVGFEPTTSSMPWKRAPNCATGPQHAKKLRVRRVSNTAIFPQLTRIVKRPRSLCEITRKSVF
jgi:hypothetical protein